MRTDLSRRHFLEPALGTAILLFVPGCGGGGSDGGLSPADSAAALGATPSGTPINTPGTTPNAGCGSIFDYNHGHVLSVLKSDLDSTAAVSYDIHGKADHTHAVTLTAAQLATLKTGAIATVTSSTTDYHEHVITVSCV
jgi:hypothetical protein